MIGASQLRIYDALHDPVVLRRVLPGIQSLSKTDDGNYELSATLKLGAFRPTFDGTVQLYNQDRPSGYSLRGRADSPNGNALGSAHVALAAIDDDTTNLAYHISVEFDGPLAGLDVLRLETTARTLTNEFFSRLQLLLDGEELAPAAAVAEPDAAPAPSMPSPKPQRSLASQITTAEPIFASTDATGGYVSTPASRTAPGEGGEWPDPTATGRPATGGTATPLETTGYVPRPPAPAMEPQSSGGIGRWIGVVIGLLLIAALLNNNF